MKYQFIPLFSLLCFVSSLSYAGPEDFILGYVSKVMQESRSRRPERRTPVLPRLEPTEGLGIVSLPGISQIDLSNVLQSVALAFESSRNINNNENNRIVEKDNNNENTQPINGLSETGNFVGPATQIMNEIYRSTVNFRDRRQQQNDSFAISVLRVLNAFGRISGDMQLPGFATLFAGEVQSSQRNLRNASALCRLLIARLRTASIPQYQLAQVRFTSGDEVVLAFPTPISLSEQVIEIYSLPNDVILFDPLTGKTFIGKKEVEKRLRGFTPRYQLGRNIILPIFQLNFENGRLLQLTGDLKPQNNRLDFNQLPENVKLSDEQLDCFAEGANEVRSHFELVLEENFLVISHYDTSNPNGTMMQEIVNAYIDDLRVGDASLSRLNLRLAQEILKLKKNQKVTNILIKSDVKGLFKKLFKRAEKLVNSQKKKK